MCTTSGNQTPNGSTKQKAQTQGAPLPAVRSCRRRRPARAQTAPPEPERNTKQKSRKTEPGSRYGAATRDSGAAMRTSTLTTRDRDGWQFPRSQQQRPIDAALHSPARRGRVRAGTHSAPTAKRKTRKITLRGCPRVTTQTRVAAQHAQSMLAQTCDGHKKQSHTRRASGRANETCDTRQSARMRGRSPTRQAETACLFVVGERQRSVLREGVEHQRPRQQVRCKSNSTIAHAERCTNVKEP